MKLKDSYHPYAGLTVLLWSLAYVCTRLALQYFSVFSLGFLRYLVSSLVMLIAALVTRMKLPRRADVPWFLLSGGIGFFLYIIAFNCGQATVSSATASVLIATAPVMTALLAQIFYREKLRAYQWAATAIEFAGVLILTLMNGAFSVNRGLIWLFVAALALSGYNLIQRKLTRTYSPLQASAFSILLGTLMLAIFSPAAMGELVHAPAIQFVYLGVLGVGSGAVAYAAWAKAYAKAESTSQVSNYMFFTPFLATIFGFVFGGEIPDQATLLGGAVIIAGVLIFNFGGRLLRAVHHTKDETPVV